MLKIYGSMLCPDCVRCKEELDRAGVPYEYFDFSESLIHLKEFLRLRDNDPVFEEVRKSGKIGIPCIMSPDGKISLDWEVWL